MVEHLNLEESDHCPILIKTKGKKVFSRRPFRFLHAWISDNSSFQVINSAWNKEVKGGMESHKLGRRLNSTTRALKDWNKHQFAFVQHKTKGLEEELNAIQMGNSSANVNQHCILEELRVQRARLESIYK